MDKPEEAIVRSWHVNAQAWTNAVRSRGIASRRLVTDQAIVEAILSLAPRQVLDVGCGEGWLARALQPNGISVLGIDLVPQLIAEAKLLGGGEFAVHSYADVAERRLDCGSFDVVACNFSLLGCESVELLLAGVRGYLNERGSLIVQTLHPVAACGDHAYSDGWRSGHWTGFDAAFSDPAPWYFRTQSSWYAMLRRLGFDVAQWREPTLPGAAAPSSLLMICRVAGSMGHEADPL